MEKNKKAHIHHAKWDPAVHMLLVHQWAQSPERAHGQMNLWVGSGVQAQNFLDSEDNGSHGNDTRQPRGLSLPNPAALCSAALQPAMRILSSA